MGFPNLTQPQAQPQPQQAQPEYQTSPEEINQGHQQIDAVMDGLIKLVSKPKGHLTKKDVFDETSEMIARGAFPTAEAKQQLIGQLAKLPNDEESIRRGLGTQLLNLSQFRNHFHNAFGAPPDPTEALKQGNQ
jgi:hypothetical protein